MWYNYFSDSLIKEWYVNDILYTRVFIKKLKSSFIIVIVYVNDMNLFSTHDEIQKTTEYLERDFEMKVLRKINCCLDLEIKHRSYGILVHQKVCANKI